MDAPTGPLWSQKQAIAYEVALEAINDVIAGYSEQIALEQTHPAPHTARITWLELRTDQAVYVHHSLHVCDDGNVPKARSAERRAGNASCRTCRVRGYRKP